MKNIDIMCGKLSNSIFDILDKINNNGYGTAFILNEKKEFIGLVTDGDIRKAILKGVSLNESIETIINRNPIVAKPNISEQAILDIMIQKHIYSIPIVNDKKEVVDWYHITHFMKWEYTEKQSKGTDKKRKISSILITGGAGYIGSVLSRYLLNKNYKIKVLDKLYFGIKPIEDLIENPNFELIKGDFTDTATLLKALENVSIVVHLAAIVGDPACKIDPDLTLEVNQYGVKVLAELCKVKKIKRLIFFSTCSVYGYSNETINEKSKLNPVSLYAETKIKAEQYILTLKDTNFHPTVIRLATVFGLSPRMRFDLVINLLAAKAVRENKITIYAGEQWRPFVHVKDIARAVHKLFTADVDIVSGEIFNVGGNTLNYKIKDLVPFYKKIFPNIEVVEVKDKEDSRSYKVEFDKINQLLNFNLKFRIEDGLVEINEFLKENSKINYQSDQYSNVKNFKYGILSSLFME